MTWRGRAWPQLQLRRQMRSLVLDSLGTHLHGVRHGIGQRDTSGQLKGEAPEERIASAGGVHHRYRCGTDCALPVGVAVGGPVGSRGHHDRSRAELCAIFHYDLLTKPVCIPEDRATLPVVEIGTEEYYVRREVVLTHDVPAALADLRAGRRPSLAAQATTVDIYYRTGALNAVLSTNHEEIMHFTGTHGVPGAGTALTAGRDSAKVLS